MTTSVTRHLSKNASFNDNISDWAPIKKASFNDNISDWAPIKKGVIQ